MNARRVLGNTSPRHYFSKPSNLAYHDLATEYPSPPATANILGLSMKFIPVPEKSTSVKYMESSFENFDRQIGLKSHFADEIDIDNAVPPLRVKSKWHPPLPSLEIDHRTQQFGIALKNMFRKRRFGIPNMPAFERRVLEQLRADDQFVYANSDKGLGPVRVHISRYIRDALKFLENPEAYEIISEEQGLADVEELESLIFAWTVEYRSVIKDDDAIMYIRKKLEETKADPFGYFYLLYKLHKNPIKTRPVCSDCGSLPHALGQWVDLMLQPMARAQHTYFKDTFELKDELDGLQLPHNCSLFTYDAIQMYDKIDTDDCIEKLKKYLSSVETTTRFTHYPPKALIEAIEIVMRNNRMRFGDILVRQLVGIAMGMSPAPSIANIYVAIHETQSILKWLNICIRYLKRFIDDGIGIWVHDMDPVIDEQNWARFKREINSGGLGWTFSKRAQSLDYMDITISIKNGRIETTIFEKPLALHLYIPPHSCHPPGVFPGLVHGKILRIYRLCSNEVDIEEKLGKFFGQLLDRGHCFKRILPVFSKAMDNAKRYISTSKEYRFQQSEKKRLASKRQVYLHVPYHPGNPTSRDLQRLWRNIVFHPKGKRPLNLCTNSLGYEIPVDRMIIAYHRAPNLGNMLSYRKICNRSGPKVSSYLTRHE